MKIGDIPIKRDLEFHPRREVWSRYEILAGEASVWLRHILTKLLEVDVEKLPKEGQIPEGGLIHQTQVVVTAFFPESYKGTPAKRPIPRKGLKDGKDLDFVNERLRRTNLDHAFNFVGDLVEIFHAECHRHPLIRSKGVNQERHLASFNIFKQ